MRGRRESAAQGRAVRLAQAMRAGAYIQPEGGATGAGRAQEGGAAAEMYAGDESSRRQPPMPLDRGGLAPRQMRMIMARMYKGSAVAYGGPAELRRRAARGRGGRARCGSGPRLGAAGAGPLRRGARRPGHAGGCGSLALSGPGAARLQAEGGAAAGQAASGSTGGLRAGLHAKPAGEGRRGAKGGPCGSRRRGRLTPRRWPFA